MSPLPTTLEGSINQTVKKAIADAFEDAEIEVQGGGGHFRIEIKSAAFAGQSKLQSHRMVMRAIKHLMDGDNAPVHAIDSLRTITP